MTGSFCFTENLGIQNAARFSYLSKSECYEVEGIDDYKEFQDVVNAMKIIKISESHIQSILRIIAGILHLGNVNFVANNNFAQVENEKCKTRLIQLASCLVA